MSCLLKENFEAEVESSAEVFEGVLGEADVPDKEWRLGNYEILEEIGRGGMGVIYRARQRHSGRIVALKRVVTYHADSHETLARFRREAGAAASLDHPNILPVYEVSETEDGLPFFSMKFATGGSLRTGASGLRGEPRECVRLMAKIARAIEYAHTHGILHRDLQPGNILLDARGEPLVSDFGLAKWLDEESDLTRTLTTFGTPGYIAPEQAEGARLRSCRGYLQSRRDPVQFACRPAAFHRRECAFGYSAGSRNSGAEAAVIRPIARSRSRNNCRALPRTRSQGTVSDRWCACGRSRALAGGTTDHCAARASTSASFPLVAAKSNFSERGYCVPFARACRCLATRGEVCCA